MNQPLVFQDVTFNAVDRAGQPWLRYQEIADAFGYSAPRTLNELYNGHKDEFTSTMTAVVELDTAGGKQPVRIFSLRGAHLLGMFARTERAKEFRRWVLNVLENMKQVGPVMLPAADRHIDRDTELAIKQRAKVLADSFYAFYCISMRQQIREGALAASAVASWMPTGSHPAGFGFSGEKHSRWFVYYDEHGLPHVQRMKIGEVMIEWADYKAMHDAISAFRRRYEPPMGLPFN